MLQVGSGSGAKVPDPDPYHWAYLDATKKDNLVLVSFANPALQLGRYTLHTKSNLADPLFQENAAPDPIFLENAAPEIVLTNSPANIIPLNCTASVESYFCNNFPAMTFCLLFL